MKKRLFTALNAAAVTLISAVICVSGLAFLVLKTVSIPFVPNRNIDNMSDYYTAVWNSMKWNSVDEGRFVLVDVSENQREEIASILSVINEMRPGIIGLDVTNIWGTESKEDSLWVETIQSIPNIVLPVEYYNKGQEKFRYSFFANRLKDKEYGVVSIPDNRDILRTYRPSFRIGEESYDAFGCVIAEKCGADISFAKRRKKLLINYTTLRLNDDDAIAGKDFLNLDERRFSILAPQIEDRIVLIGSTHSTSDQHLTPLGNNISGLLVHAHISNTLMEGKSVHSIPSILRYVLCFILAFVALLWYQNRKADSPKMNKLWKRGLWAVVVFVSSMIIFSGLGTLLFCSLNYYANFTPYIVTLILVYLLNNKIAARNR